MSMTTQSEYENIDPINDISHTKTVELQSSINEPDKNHEALSTIDKNEENIRNNAIHQTEVNNINGDNEINSNQTTRVNDTEEQEQRKQETIVNNHGDEHRPKKAFNSKYRHSSLPYHRSPYYTNSHPYGPPPYYYYHVAPINEKPPPLMIIPTQPPSTSSLTTTNAASTTITTTTTTTTAVDTSTTNSSQNLPPRLRQASANDNESNPQQQAPATNTRRHRSILPRSSSSNYYSQHPPPPLMATPPGVLFPYPPTFHQPGHVAYNIRTPDEYELLAFQQQVMNLPPPLIWPPTAAYPHYPPYSIYESSAFVYNNLSTADSNNSLLNPEAAEWIPPANDNEVEVPSSDNNILIDDEINFPPLNNNNRVEEHSAEQPTNQTESSPEMDLIDNVDDKTAILPSKSETTLPTTTATVITSTTTTANSSSSQEDNKNASSSSSKPTTLSYSNIILQTLDVNKSNKTLNTNNKIQARQPSSTYTQTTSKDRLTKQQKPQNSIAKDTGPRRRQPQLNRSNYYEIRNSLLPDIPKQQQQQLTDDWIEVKSKKTKKFDRSISDIQYENLPSVSQKSLSDQQIPKTLSPPSSLSSASDNTMGTYTSSSDDDKDHINPVSDNTAITTMENKTMTTTSNDCNQTIIDDIHRRLDKGERLLIIMRGCPGSGKSTLAKSINNGYHGQILSANEYQFDTNKLETIHLENHRMAYDAFKQKISPVIIDNTNTTSSEMKPYATMGKEAGYDILLIEPQTPWRYKARELVKRNVHNIQWRRIKEMLNNFEHNVKIESLIDYTKANQCVPCQSQQTAKQLGPLSDSKYDSKKSLNIIHDSDILDDVRLCINDMILFLTSTFYQTSRSSTSLSLTFSDLLIPPSSSPTTPTTPHSLFHRSLPRFPSTTTVQDHAFANEHLLRLPASTFSRCMEKFTPSSSTNSSMIGKKRRKNKSKQQHSSGISLNTNNNNNNNNNNTVIDNAYYFQQPIYDVILAEDHSDFIIIDEQQDYQTTSQWNHSSLYPQATAPAKIEKSNLVNIIRNELTNRVTLSVDQQSSSKLTNDVVVQCSPNDFNLKSDSSDRILTGNLSAQSIVSSPTPLRPGFIECGVQADLGEHNVQSLADLIELYKDRLPSEMIKQFYDLCLSDVHWTRAHIDDHLKHHHETSVFPTLRQLSFNALSEWNHQLKSSNPSFDTISIEDLLQDINDEDLFNDLRLNDDLPVDSNEITDVNQIKVPWSIVNSLQQIYGELPLPSSSTSTASGYSLPLDDDFSLHIYQALQRSLGISAKTNKPVIEKKLIKENKKLNKKRWNTPTQDDSKITPIKTTSGPSSFREIMNEELNYQNKEKPVQRRQLDFASQHKLEKLERHFPELSFEVLYDIFCENELDFDLTFACISSMIDETVPINITEKTQPSSIARSTTSKKLTVESDFKSFEDSRGEAQLYASKRKEYYNKADQANRHGMVGVASYYINQAREQTRLMKEANRAASEYLSKIRLNQFRQTHRLDLHELYADEALQLFKQVEQELSEGNRRTTSKSVEVITGYGKSSVYGGGCGKIRAVLLAYLQQKRYKYSEPNKGAILVQF